MGGMQGGMPGQGPGMNAEEAMMPGGENRASPEEQELYEKFVKNAIRVIYSDATFPKVLELLKAEPKEGVAVAASTIVARVATAAEKKGMKLNGDVVFAAGKTIVEDLINLSEKAGIHEYSQEEVEGVFYNTLDTFRGLMDKAGRINKQAAERDFAKLQQMNQSGEIDRMMMGLVEKERSMAEERSGRKRQEVASRGGGLGAVMKGEM